MGVLPTSGRQGKTVCVNRLAVAFAAAVDALDHGALGGAGEVAADLFRVDHF